MSLNEYASKNLGTFFGKRNTGYSEYSDYGVKTETTH